MYLSSLVYYLNVNTLIWSNEAHCVMTMQLEPLLLKVLHNIHESMSKKNYYSNTHSLISTLAYLELQYEFSLYYLKKWSKVEYECK